MAGQELASHVSCKKAYGWEKSSIELTIPPWSESMGESGRVSDTRKFRVAAYDFGIKQNILRLLVDHHCDVWVVPAQTSAKDVMDLKPDGVFPFERSRRSRAHRLRRRKYSKAPRARPHLRHLPRPPALRPRARRQNLQAEIRPPRFESSRAKICRIRKLKSPRKITASASIPNRFLPVMLRSPTSTSTTTPTKACATRSCHFSVSSTTPKPHPARTIRTTSSPSSPT